MIPGQYEGRDNPSSLDKSLTWIRRDMLYYVCLPNFSTFPWLPHSLQSHASPTVCSNEELQFGLDNTMRPGISWGVGRRRYKKRKEGMGKEWNILGFEYPRFKREISKNKTLWITGLWSGHSISETYFGVLLNMGCWNFLSKTSAPLCGERFSK